MTDVRYDLQILLGGAGFGYGINDVGEAVGVGIDGSPAEWIPAYPNAPVYPSAPVIPFGPDPIGGGELVKVDNFGNAVGLHNVDPVVVNGLNLIVDLGSIGVPSDINNYATIVGTVGVLGPGGLLATFGSQAFIYSFLPIPGNKTLLSPLPNSAGISATGINDLGDVVGGCDNNAGFFYSASTKKMIGIDSCYFYDINVNRLAVGESVIDPPGNYQPVMVDLSKAAPVLQSIPVPKPFVGATATAVNSSNTIVGFCDSQDSSDVCAFVSFNGESFDLNTLLGSPISYTLIDAMDINEAGQIVGTAVTGPIDQITGVYPYVATPYLLPPPPIGPVRSWPFPIWMWPWGWLPNPGIPPSQFGPSPMFSLSAQISRMPISGKQPSPHLQKMLAAHLARIRRHASKKQNRRGSKKA